MNLTPELFQQHFEVDDDTLIMSPLSASCADKLGYNFTYELYPTFNLEKRYDLIIGDYDEKNPVHPRANFQSPSYLLYVIQAFDRRLSDDGKIIMKLPLEFIRFAQKMTKKGPSYRRFNITNMDIYDDYLVATITKGKYQQTVITYSTGETFECDIHKTNILSRYDEKQYSFIKSYFDNIDQKDYLDMIKINGQNIKDGVQESVRNSVINSNTYGLVMTINQKRIGFSKLEESRLTSSFILFTFETKSLRDKYLNAVNRRPVLQLQLSLSYGGTIPSRIVPMILHPSILSYA